MEWKGHSEGLAVWQSGSDTQQMCNANCFFSSCPLCLIFLEKVGNPFCELFRTRAWPSRFQRKQGIFEQKLELNPTARLQNESTPNGFRPLAAIATLDLRESYELCGFVVVLSCLPCCFFCLRSQGRILRVRCRCSRIGTSSNWENARNRWHQDLAQSEKPQSFQVSKVSLANQCDWLEIFPFETRIDFMTSCPRDWIKQLLGSNGNGHTRIHQAFGIHDWT